MYTHFNSKNVFQFVLVCTLVFAWIFSGWPQLFDLPPEPKVAQAAGPAFESGTVTLGDSLDWSTITLSNSYASNPVIFVTPVTATNCAGSCSGTGAGNGGMYPIPLVRNVSNGNFDIAMCIDGGNTTCDTGPDVSSETFHWFAFDADDATNHSWIEVGTTTNVDVSGGNTSETFSSSFASAPVVWTQAQTYSQGSSIGAVAWVNDTVTTSGFTYIGCTHQGVLDTCSGGTNEIFGYVAIDTTNASFDSSANFQTGMADITHSAWSQASFSPSYSDARVMVTQNDDDGAQDPQYSWARNVTNDGMEFRYCEEDAGDVCNTHTSEWVHWFAFDTTIAIESLDAGSCNSESIDITWNDINGEDGYIVYRNGTTSEDIVETLPAASSGPYSYTDTFSDGTFATGTSYTYYVGYYIGDKTVISASSSITSAYNCAECGSAEDTPTDTEPTENLCGSGSSLSGSVDTNPDDTRWVWNCRNDDAFSDGVTVENSCEVENTNGVYIKDFNLNPRIVSNSTDNCTINYTIESSNSASTTCQLGDTSGATSSLSIDSDTVVASTSDDINPGKSYKISCVYDETGENIQKETEYRSCSLNPSFEEF